MSMGVGALPAGDEEVTQAVPDSSEIATTRDENDDEKSFICSSIGS